MKENKNMVHRTMVYYIVPSQELIDELFEGKISFKVDDLAEAETVLQIMYLITEKLEEIKTNKKYKKEALNAD